MINKVRVLSVALLGAFIFQVSPAFADSSAEMMSMLKSLQQQIANMQTTIDSQNKRIQQLEGPNTDDAKKIVRDSVAAAMPWTKGVKYGGDFRVRYESFTYYNKNDDAGSTGLAADRTRNRFRIRLRWGMEKDLGEDWKVGFRIDTGNTTDPTSTWQTIGNSGYFVFKNVVFDRAYATYEPSALKDKGPLKDVKIGLGKFENPFFRYSTPMVWDSDVTPEGIYERANLSLINTDSDKLNAQATTGQFIVNENTSLDSDANIFAYQGALSWSTKIFNTDKPVEIATAVSFYDYTNWFRTVLASGNTVATSYIRTNSIVADDFRVLDIYPEVNFYVNQTPVMLWYDYALNTANVGTADAAQSLGNDIHDSDQGWGVGGKIGSAKKKGDWETFYSYYEIGANSVVAAFNDADLGGPGQLGYTNRKGHRAGTTYNLTDNVALSFNVLFFQPLNPFSGGSATTGLQNASNESVFRTQLDLNYKF